MWQNWPALVPSPGHPFASGVAPDNIAREAIRDRIIFTVDVANGPGAPTLGEPFAKVVAFLQKLRLSLMQFDDIL